MWFRLFLWDSGLLWLLKQYEDILTLGEKNSSLSILVDISQKNKIKIKKRERKRDFWADMEMPSLGKGKKWP